MLNPGAASTSWRSLWRYVIAVSIILSSASYYANYHSDLPIQVPDFSTITDYIPYYNPTAFSPNATDRLPHIPPKIWQIWLDSATSAPDHFASSAMSFIKNSAGYAYTVVDSAGALALITRVSQSRKHARMLELYQAIPRRVMRADFLRYLLLAVEGGVYSDADTIMVRPVREWVPDEYKDKAKIIVGIEGDKDEPVEVTGAAYEVQFCMWTIASSANHPLLWKMIDRILSLLAAGIGTDVSDEDVLRISGPQGWSEVVYGALSDAVGREVNYTHVKHLQEPQLFGDILVLPVDLFSDGPRTPDGWLVAPDRAMVRHNSAGWWRNHGDVTSR